MEDNRQDENNQDSQRQESQRPVPPNLMAWILVIVVGCVLISSLIWFSNRPDYSTITVGYFNKLLKGRDFEGNPLLDENGESVDCAIETIILNDEGIVGTFKEGFIPPPEKKVNRNNELVDAPKETKLKKKFRVRLRPNSNIRDRVVADIEQAKIARYDHQSNDTAAAYYMGMLILFTVGIFFLMYMTLRRAQNQMMGGGGFLSNFSRSPAKKYESSSEPITFDNVAGLEGVKADLLEIVEFLRDPTKFQKLGGRVPKGVLLVGPPGTGKTLLARAVAGEAEVPYFSVNGSEFIQMFVGVGASRVRDLFATAKAQSPAIIFIDEIDAVGRQRGAGLGGGHDEREQTLNQILGEMDGFQKNDSVIVLAATNRPDILDPALLRPGRFDRHVTVSKPTVNGRKAIFKVHVRDVPLGPDVDLDAMAQATVGMTGADIQNLINEASLWAARNEKTRVEMADFYYAHDKVLMGAKREEILNELEKQRTAYHEAGHTIAAWKLKGANPVHKVTIIPRGQALGVTQMVPDEDRLNMSEQEIRHHLIVLLAGRAAEKLIYDEFTVGAENDLERATSMARRMVTQWGMSERLGPVSYKMTDEDPFLGREMHQSRQFSEHTMEVIDDEVSKILRDAAADALKLLETEQESLQIITDGLLSSEELDRKQIAELIGPSVHNNPAAESSTDSNEKTEQPNENELNGAPASDSTPSETTVD